MRDVNVFNIARSYPRMSWSPKNLYNLWQRSQGPKKRELVFKDTQQTLFQQRWKSKAAIRAYHGDYIPEKIFKRWYLPDNIPDVRPRKAIMADDKSMLEEYAGRKQREKEYEEDEQRRGMAPVGSLVLAEVERRIDVVVFRSCFAHSIYEARRLVVHGNVLLNGKRHTNANTRLAPGDMISVDPDAIRFFRPPTAEYADDVNAQEPDKDSLTPFNLPLYASPWLFVPAYIEPNFATCSAVYVRHPTARPGYSEVPTPYDADGEVVRFAWEWYVKRKPRIRSQKRLSMRPEDRAFDISEIDTEKERKYLRKAAQKRAATTSGMIF
ncbi:alpha-L RNA-binding motif-containing protein [Marasmius fiardii PR-910]|nr:alpha-L RNA-binding motif-containing protein [Marasmius fiardii PR-910]